MVYPGLVSRMGSGPDGKVCAEDVVQEALVRAWERSAAGEPVESLPGWVTAVAANLARDRWRRARAEERALLRLGLQRPGAEEGLAPHEPDDGPLADLAGLVRSLPRRQRDAVVLHYYGDLSVKEVAAVLGISEGTVKSTLSRARRALGHLLAGPPDPGSEIERAERSGAVVGWYMSGDRSGEYEHGILEGEQLDGKRIAFVRCQVDAPSGFGTLMQNIAAKEYVGKRVRFSGVLRTTDAGGWAGLWMRVDGRASRRPLAFDNMQNRAVKGTTDWKRYEVVLDVADEAAGVAFGTILSGGGEVRMADFRFEVVSKDVPTTSSADDHPTVPQNLDFSVGDN